MSIKFVDNHIENTELPKKLKKITGTRFGAVLGLNRWSSPFQAWCEITKTYEKPFVDSKETLAGKAIEPKQAEFLKNKYFLPITTPTDVYGKDYFNKTYGDFYPDFETFGGMWDFLSYDETSGELDCVIECKTTKRVEDWNNDIPIYYALQAALYAWLKDCDNVVMVASFLEEKDYEHPENYECTYENTIVKTFKVSEKFPDFSAKVAKAIDFWKNNVLKGISPDYDEKVDKEYLDALRKNNLNPNTEIKELVSEYENLSKEIDEVIGGIKAKTDRLDTLKGLIKEYMSNELVDGKTKSEIKGNSLIFTCSKSITTSIDKDKLKKDGLLSRYEKQTETTRFTTKEIKEE